MKLNFDYITATTIIFNNIFYLTLIRNVAKGFL